MGSAEPEEEEEEEEDTLLWSEPHLNSTASSCMLTLGLGTSPFLPRPPSVGLRVRLTDVAQLAGGCFSAVPRLVAHHQDDDEHQQRGHDHGAHHQDHGAAQQLSVQRLALRVLVPGVELHAAHHVSGSERGGRVVPGGQHTQVIESP